MIPNVIHYNHITIHTYLRAYIYIYTYYISYICTIIIHIIINSYFGLENNHTTALAISSNHDVSPSDTHRLYRVTWSHEERHRTVQPHNSEGVQHVGLFKGS